MQTYITKGTCSRQIIYDVTPDEVAARTTLTAERLFLN